MASVGDPDAVSAGMQLGDEYFGDGAMRQLNPAEPRRSTSARTVCWSSACARGVRRAWRDAGSPIDTRADAGQIFGYMLDTLFTDQIYGDLEQLRAHQSNCVHIAPEQAPGAGCRNADAGAERGSARDRRATYR